MPKRRGFQPQGIINPMLTCKRKLPSGPSILEKLQRDSRPTWEELKKLAKKKHATSTEALEKWENENYLDELTRIRNSKRASQEKEELERLKKIAKKLRNEKRKKRNATEESSVKSSDRSSSDIDSDKSGSKKSTIKKKKKRKVESVKNNNPYKLSSFFKSFNAYE